MITNISNIYKIKDNEPAFVCETSGICKAGEKYPLYIPQLMPKINFRIPKIETIRSRGTLCFRNAPRCRILTASVIRTQNYLNIPFERNKSWDSQYDIDDAGNKFIRKGTRVICKCPTSSIKDMTFSND